MGALGGHRRFCAQLSTAAAPRAVFVDDLELTDADGGAPAVALPPTPATALPAHLAPGVLSSFDFLRYFFVAVVPSATLLDSRVDSSLLSGEAEHVTLRDAAEPAAQRRSARPSAKALLKEKRAKKRPSVRAHWEVSLRPRQMLDAVQSAEWADWEGMLLGDADGADDDARPGAGSHRLLHALHVLCTQLLCIDLLAPTAVHAGATFAMTLGGSVAREMGSCPVNAHTWPELLRMAPNAAARPDSPRP